MDRVFVVRAECGDYYCGCGGGHILAVAETRGRAEELAAEAQIALSHYDHAVYRRWVHGVDIEGYEVGRLTENGRSEDHRTG